jgi:tetratricopeptide (TPR) repeat protein
MQAMMGDSLSWSGALNDYVAAYPKSYEGYQSQAEYTAIYCRDMEQADKAWDKALSLTENKAEVFFGKGRVINEIVQSGDTLSHAMLTFGNALEQIDKAISINNSSLYVNYKADMLYGAQRFADAAECYESLATTDMRSPELFAKASQCYIVMQNYDKGIEMLDSAVACFPDGNRGVAPYLLTRGVVKSSAKRYREAVQDMNRYEELVGGLLSADFYYARGQAELNCKMYQQALNDIETALALDSDNLLYYLEKGMLCYRVKFTDEGVRTMLKACELAPELADAHYLLGRLYMQKENIAEARKSLETADKLGHPDARVQLDALE